MTSLDTERAERRMWLVRVPPYIAERWKRACGQGAQGADEDMDEEGSSSTLGKITIANLPDGKSVTMLELPESMVDGAMPRRYTLQPAAGDAPDMSVLSSEAETAAANGSSGGAAAAEGDALRLVKPRLDGIVSQKYDAVPAQTSARVGQGGAAADEAYRALTRKRTLASLQKGRSVAVITDPKAATKLYQQQHHRTALYADKEEYEARSARELKGPALNRRVRMERPELEQALFALFERQPHWAFMALQKETDQPGGWLREVLSEVALQVKRGPHKDLWELQKQYKVAGGGGGGNGGGGAV